MYECEIVDNNGCVWSSVEHAYQAMKSVNPLIRSDIANASTPWDALKKGRKVKPRANWDDIKVDVMLRILVRKFTPGTPLADMLVATGDAWLVEDGDVTHNKFWAVDSQGVGENMLGRLLMAIRSQLLDI
jgi:ribA/ribD-fused uncharacterized protein